MTKRCLVAQFRVRSVYLDRVKAAQRRGKKQMRAMKSKKKMVTGKEKRKERKWFLRGEEERKKRKVGKKNENEWSKIILKYREG